MYNYIYIRTYTHIIHTYFQSRNSWILWDYLPFCVASTPSTPLQQFEASRLYFLGADACGDSPKIFPKVLQSSQTESSGFPGYPLPLDTPPLKNPIITRVSCDMSENHYGFETLWWNHQKILKNRKSQVVLLHCHSPQCLWDAFYL